MASTFDTLSGRYGTVAGLADEAARRLVVHSGLQPGERVLDLGTGGGQVLALAASAVGPTGHVVGVDFSSGMLTRAALRLTEEGVPNAALARMDVEQLGVAGGSVDVVTAGLLFQYLPEKRRAVAECRRVLRPGGRVALSVPIVVAPPFMMELASAFLPRTSERFRQLAASGASWRDRDAEAWCREAGFANVDWLDEDSAQVFPSAEEWWDFNWTHGARAFLEALDGIALHELREQAVSQARASALPSGEFAMPTTVRYCTALAT